MKITSIGYKLAEIHRQVQKGEIPSQLLYGLYEMEQSPNNQITYIELSSDKNYISDIKNILHTHADILFFPYIHSNVIYILLLLKKLKIISCKITGICHQTPHYHNSCQRYIMKSLHNQFDWVFFHSPLNRTEYLQLQYGIQQKTSIIPWGVDLEYYEPIYQSTPTSKSKKFISTGIENRDYKTMINAFSSVTERLNLFVQANNPINSSLENIKITKVHQDDNTIKTLATEVCKSYGIIVSLMKEHCNYCVGHTTMVEAMALGKPIIVTDNPYHPIDVEKVGIGLKFEAGNPQSLESKIHYLLSHQKETEYMGMRAKKLASQIYNIKNCSLHIYKTFSSLCHK